MSRFLKNKQKFTLALGAIFLAVTMLVGTLAYFTEGFPGVAVVEEPAAATEPETIPEETEPATEEETEPPTEPEPVSFNVPAEMRGTFLVPGVDFLKTEDTSEATIKKEIDDAFLAAEELTINAVVIDTAYEDHVIYQTMGAPEVSSGFDLLGYIADRARQEGFYTYAIFDAGLYGERQTVTPMAIGGGVDKLAANLGEFAEKYALDGVLIDGYQNSGEDQSYGDYLSLGGGMGFGNFMRQSPAAIVKTASQAVREAAPSTQVGILADAVWENASQNEQGSATEAAFTSLSNGNADTKGFIEKGFVDFVAVKAYTTMESTTEPFAEVAKWWGDVARQNDIPMYVVHAADKIGSGETGWGSQDQILKQVIEAAEIGGVRGSIFNRLAPLASQQTNVGTNLTKLYTEEAAPEQILTQLEMTKPSQTTFTTSDPFVTFTGASDPGEPVTINGAAVDSDQTGYFTVQMELGTGLNNFSIIHKDKQIDYAITREIEVLESAAPMQDVTVEGGMTVTISAVAYMDADVYAIVGGTTVEMGIDDSLEDEGSRDGFFRTFVGEFRAPAATGELQTVGSISVHAAYDGEEDSIQGGTVYVNKKAKLEDGVAVRVVADQAITYPPDTSNNVPVSTYYPLPKGAMDYAVGDEISYSKVNNKGVTETFTYFVLASGLRVESGDIAAITDDYPSNNVISGLTVTADDDSTYVTLTTAQQVSYSVKYASTGISFEFHNTTSVPAGMGLSKNPLFGDAGWSGTTLTLSFLQQGSFMGYKGYYDENGNLVLRFRNPPSSISNARIAIDPGHGGGDNGTSGFLSDYPEKTINSQIAAYLAEELAARGATVNLMNNSGIEGPERKQEAERWNADLFVSIHNNSAPNTSATGTEVYYFHPFSYRLAYAAADYVSDGLDTINRGAKQSYYHVSLSSQFPSVLIECGFLSNRGEYEKIVSSGYQKSVAVGIADALSATIKSTYTGGGYAGSESTGSSATPGGQGNGTGSGKPAEEIYLTDTELGVGEIESLKTEFYPAGSGGKVTWESDDTWVATVKDGKVTGVREGEVTITARLENGASDSCVVTVTKSGSQSGGGGSAGYDDSGVKLSTVNDAFLDRDEITLNPSNTVRIEVLSDRGETIRGGDFKWSSDDTSIATVDAYGYVKAKDYGEATVTATAAGYRLECDIYVSSTQYKVTGIRLEKSDVTVYEGDTSTVLRTVFSPANASNQAVVWSTSDGNILTVNQDGVVNARRPGKVTVTVKTRDGGYTASCAVTVLDEDAEVEYIDFWPDRLEMGVGDEDQLFPELEPNIPVGLRWESSDPKVVTVDQNGSIEAIAPGEATVTCATTEGRRVTGSCEIEVID